MSYLLELLGRGLESPLMSLVLPFSRPLTTQDVRVLEETLAEDTGHIGNQLRLGIHYAQSGSEEQAEALFEQLLRDNPHHADAPLAWAAMHASAGALDDAIERLQQMMQFHADDGRVLFALGYLHRSLS